MKFPLAIISFDRPEYLRETLESLAAQSESLMDGRDIFLFQDGSVNLFSGRVCAEKTKIESSISIFKAIFPHGKVVESEVNLGIGLHFDKIEKFLFEEIGYEAAIFLEDDFVLGENYLQVIDALIGQATQDERIGYVSAIGDHLLGSLSPDDLDEPILLKQNWAFGLTKKHWVENKKYIDQYIKLISGIDYKHRPHNKIFDLYEEWGVARMESSQDRAKFIASTLNGRLRLSTKGCYGKYIGKVGVHSSSDSYAASKFDETVLCDYPIKRFQEIGEDHFKKLLSMQWTHIKPPPPEMKLNQPLEIFSGSPDCVCLTTGFHPPESDGAWSARAVSRIDFIFDFSDVEQKAFLEVQLRHFLGDGVKHGSVTLLLDGSEIAKSESSGQIEVIRSPIDKDTLSNIKVHRLEIRVDPFLSPSQFGGTDKRTLGVLLKSIAVIAN